MAPLLVHLRAELRRRWPTWLAVVVVIGVVGGLVLGTLAGARRTDTAFDRLVADTESWDLLVNPNEGVDSALDTDQVAALAQIERLGAVEGVGAVLLGDDGEPLADEALVLAADGPEVLVEFARPRVVEGAVFDPSDPTAVMVTDDLADDHDLDAGDDIAIGTVSFDEILEWEESGGEGLPPITPRPARVSAVVVTHDSLVVDEAFDGGTIYLSKAFADEYELEPFYYGLAIRLRDGGADVPAVRTAIQDLAPGEAIEFKTGAAVEETVDRGTRPHVVALLLFAAAVGLAGFVVAAQATTRQLDGIREDAGALRALGVDRRELRRAAVLRVGVLAVAGTATALVMAIALSPLFPLGVAERAEIDPGLDVDPMILVPGAALLVLGIVGWGALAARSVAASDVGSRVRSVAWTERVSSSIPGPVVSMGLRAALAPGTGRPIPARTALAGLSLAVAAVAATMTFGASLGHLVSSPPAYGWNWDAYLSLPGDEWDEPPETFIDSAAASEEIDAWSSLVLDQVAVDGERVPAIGIDYRIGDVGPTIIDGQRPESEDEIVLGGRTMDLLDVGIGGVVVAGTGDRAQELDVVGQAVFPGLGTYPGADRTELGKGAMLTKETLADVGEGFLFESLAIATDDRRSLQHALEDIVGDSAAAVDEGEVEVLDEPQRPADIQNLERVQSTPLVIAAVLVVLGGVAFGFVLVSDVRGRRREIALLKTFGFQGRQVAATVSWQATATALIAVVTGIPLGIAAGRSAWSVLTGSLGVAPDPRLTAGLVVVGLGVPVIANLMALVPARLAARTRPGEILRSK